MREKKKIVHAVSRWKIKIYAKNHVSQAKLKSAKERVRKEENLQEALSAKLYRAHCNFRYRK